MDCHRKSKLLPPCLRLQLTLLPILAVIALNNASVNSQSPVGIYTAIASKLISPYSTYNVSVSVESRSSPDDASPLQFQASIVSVKENYTAEEISILPGNSGLITFQIDELTAPRYNLTLTIKDGAKGQIENVTTIFPNKKDKTILLHTDKPMYKPGETVQFRVLVLNRDMKPFPVDQELQVKIFDPEHNVIKIWENAKVQTGLFNAKLQLSSEPVLGDWNIEVKPKILPRPGSAKKPKAVVSNNEDAEAVQSKLAPGMSFIPEAAENFEDYDVEVSPTQSSVDNSQKKTLKFTVAQYVLPKFKVTIKLPTFITFNQTKVPVEVEAKYTYGKGVKGECTLVPKLPYYRRADTDKVITSTFPIDGSAVTDVDIKHLYQDGQVYEGEVHFEAQVTESVTGKSQNGTGKVYMHRYPYKIEQVAKDQNLKPGLPFTIVFKILTQDNIPIQDPAPNALKISHGFSYEAEDGTLETSIPPSGLVSVTFATPTNELIQVSRIDVTYKELKHNYYVPQKYNSESKTYMSIKLLGENMEIDPIVAPTITVNSKLQIHVNSTKTFSSLNYLIHGRSEVLAFEKVNLASPMHEHVLDIICPRKASPEARIIVYLVLSDGGEVVADSLKFQARNSEQDLDNYLNITVSDATREPGQNVSLHLTSKPNSLIALRGVDQSVLLLKEDVDITQSSVDKEIKSRNDEAMRYHRIWGGSNAFQVFEQGGLTILTNAKIQVERGPSWYEPKPYYLRRPGSSASHSKVAVNDAVFDAMPLAAAFGASESSGAPGEIRVRTEFPETWLWEEVTMNGSNTLDIHKTIPDTLTSWIITGYSLNTDSGLGVLLDPRKVTTFRPFFISLNLPYSVVKGEVLVLQVLVHNYLSTDGNTTAEITLDNSKSQFQFNDKSLKDAKEHKKTVSCLPNAVTSVSFVIVPSEFGSIMLNVKGVTPMAGDALSQVLRVKPPGQQQRRTASALLSTTAAVGSGARQTEATLSTIFPTARVQGADKVKMSLISDILGSTIANLDKMLQIPTGCGEQNMLNFVADIVILDYLKHTHNLNAKIREKAINFLETGYQRELTYRHTDGSFSAFGPSDSHGSTWLTAFVVRSFIQAKAYITIDDSVIESALEFLAKQQFANGGLFEHGKVLHSEIQGGSNTNAVALTAYTVLAFLEASQKWNNSSPSQGSNPNQEIKGNDYSSNVQQGLEYITNQTKNVDADDPYALVLTTYALQLASHPQRNEYFEKLQSFATHEGSLTFWETKNKNKSKILNVTEHHPWELVTKPVSVEMTGYALLTYILRGQLSESFPLVRWLLKERNAKGGFHSTQDTVVGLTALAKYAELTKDNVTDIQVKATYNSEDRSVAINGDNAEVLQEFELPKETSSVHFGVSGKGSVLAQLTWAYYVQDAAREPAFSVDVKVSSSKPNGLELKICTSYLRGDASNMAIIEVNLPSGYSVDRETLGDLKDAPSYKRYDTENKDTKLEIYLDSITSNTTCVPVTAVRSFKVGKQAPAFVHVYDYYDTTKFARVFYEAPNISICDICRENNDCEVNNCV